MKVIGIIIGRLILIDIFLILIMITYGIFLDMKLNKKIIKKYLERNNIKE